MNRLAWLAALSLMVGATAGCVQKKLFLVTQYSQGSPRAEEMVGGIRDMFGKQNMPYDITVFNMDLSSRPTAIWRDERAKLAVVHARSFDPDIVFVAGDEAARYFGQRLLDTSIRMIFLDVKADPSTYMFTQSLNVTGVREEVPVNEAFALMRQAVPSARGVAVLADGSLTGDAVVSRIEKAEDLPLRVVTVRRAHTLDEWMDAVRDVQDKADVLCIASYGSVRSGPGAKEAVPPDHLLRLTAAENKLPDVSFWPEAVGPDGVMAAVTVPVSRQAEIAARMASKILYYSRKIADVRIASCREKAKFVNLQRAAELGVTLSDELLDSGVQTR